MQPQHNDLPLYEQITKQLIAHLDQGIVPWHSSWVQSNVPMNLMNKRPYRAINLLLLGAHEFRQNYFLTERQIERLGGCISDGAVPHRIIDGIGFRTLRPYSVYNIRFCRGISHDLIPDPLPKSNPIDACREVLGQMYHCPKIVAGYAFSVYDLASDTIFMSKKDYISSLEEYFSAFFKPLIAACKHPMRLNWTTLAEAPETDSDAKVLETLVCEIGAFLLRNFTGLERRRDYDLKYAFSWIELLRKNVRLAYDAALMAQEAFEFVTGVQFDMLEAIEFVEDERLPF